MAQNLFNPIYGDYTSLGKAIGFIIRFIWIGYGSIISTLKIIPFLLISLVVLTLPFIGIFLIIKPLL